MAEGILRSLLPPGVADRVRVLSAGIAAAGGAPATSLAVETAEAKGIDIRRHRSTQLTPDLIRQSDLILVMESAQSGRARELAPEMAARIHLITERGAEVGEGGDATPPDVRDPIGGSAADYDDTYHRIRSHLLRWLPSIVEAVERREGVR
jgi:protein-tyrosine-phosphatase